METTAIMTIQQPKVREEPTPEIYIYVNGQLWQSRKRYTILSGVHQSNYDKTRLQITFLNQFELKENL